MDRVSTFKRSNPSQGSHDRAVRAIAAVAFNYPSAEQPNWVTYTNPGPEHNGWVKSSAGLFYPDIVTVDASQTTGNVKGIGEVETAESVNREEVPQWRTYSSVQPFFLYVPSGYGPLAKALGASIQMVVVEYWYEATGRIQLRRV